MLDSVALILAAVSWKALGIAGLAWLAGLTLWNRPAWRHALWAAAAAALLCLPAFEVLTQAAPPASLRVHLELDGAAPASSSGRESGRPSSTEVGWPAALAALYLGGLAVGLVRLRLGLLATRDLLGAASTVEDPRAIEILGGLTARCDLAPRPPLLESGSLAAPVTAGAFEPSIVLPSDHRNWPPERLEAVLAHELAHVARHDSRTAWLLALTRTLYWFHPAVWPLGRHAARLMEQACDDFAVRLTGDRRQYADALLATASLQFNLNRLRPGALAMASHLSSRIDRILAAASPGMGVLQGRAPALLAASAIAVAVAAALLSPALAQTSGVTLSGVVADASGARVPAVSVIVEDASQGVTEATVSRADGTFAIAGLQPSGHYELKVEAGGFASSRQTVSLFHDTRVEVELQVGRIREAIVVEADAPEPIDRGAAQPQRIRVGGKVQKARMVEHVMPAYPEAARAEGIEGTVLLEALISASGQPVSLSTQNQLVDSRLVDAATEAVSQWRYEPTRLNGQPVEVATTVTVGFRLKR